MEMHKDGDATGKKEIKTGKEKNLCGDKYVGQCNHEWIPVGNGILRCRKCQKEIKTG